MNYLIDLKDLMGKAVPESETAGVQALIAIAERLERLVELEEISQGWRKNLRDERTLETV